MDRAAQSLLHATSPCDLQLDKTFSTQSDNKRRLHDSKPLVRLHYVRPVSNVLILSNNEPQQNITSTAQHSAVKMVNRVHFPWQQLEGARNAVILLHERFNLDEEQRLQVFKKAYLDAAQALRPDVDISAYSISDAYNCRMRVDRKPWSVTYDGDKPNAAEKTRREGVRATALTDLQQAAQDLGLGNSIIATTTETQEPDTGNDEEVDMQLGDGDLENEDDEEPESGVGREQVHNRDDDTAEHEGPQEEEAAGTDDELDVKELGQ
ncbi:hypothetical protein LTR56_010043 [Elasticomyces elasticus]|nr:hypothetical protein LTR56_010043 [Elasticomyces elasticus]KAK3665012.1 hypothetical protein LTR22_004065 [Elasticomyces elasticus]KAK4931612.1 hypothetical protein LTR49_002003 [Elasticomyces elasticus]KAK5766771.1 hypothetical protein LTS12_003123 [Elasticomyces elasticus]